MIFNFKFNCFPDPNPSGSPIPSTSRAHEVKPEPDPIFSLFNANIGSLDDVFNSTLDSTSASATTADDDDSDVEMIGQIVPRPLDSTAEGLVKKDNDPISESKPFNTAVCLKFVQFFSISISIQKHKYKFLFL